jgi:hypothetical protein
VRDKLRDDGEIVSAEFDDGDILASMSSSLSNATSNMACNAMLYHGTCLKGSACTYNHSRDFLGKHALRVILSVTKHYGPLGLYHDLRDKPAFKGVELLAPAQKILQKPQEKTLYNPSTGTYGAVNLLRDDSMLNLEQVTSDMMGGDVTLGGLEESFNMYHADDADEDTGTHN